MRNILCIMASLAAAPACKPLDLKKDGPPPVPKDCKFGGIRTIQVARDHDHPEAGMMDYKFQVIEAMTKGAPAILQIPGGPGGNDMGPVDKKDDRDGYTKIYVDPRGVGCNYDAAVKLGANELSTMQHAHDLLDVLKSMKVKSYAIYGASYGTMVGTILAHEAEAAGVPPTIVVLQGVMGGTFLNRHQTFDEIWNALSTPEMRAFVADPPVEVSTTRAEFVVMISNLITGYPVAMIPAFEETIAAAKDGFKSKDSLAALERFQRLKKSLTTEVKYLDEEGTFAAIACKEITDGYNEGTFAIDDAGKMTFTPPTAETNLCNKAGVKLTNPYKPSDYQFKAPIYYFNGDTDPNTPLEWALEHPPQMKLAKKKEFTSVKGAGHGPVLSELSDCRTQLFDAMFALQSVKPLLTDDGNCPKALELTGGAGTDPQLLLQRIPRLKGF